MDTSPATPARIKLFWKPGCSSCLRTKEFLTKQGIAFVPVNAENNPEALAELKALGARGLPVISLGERFRCASPSARCSSSWTCSCAWPTRCRAPSCSPSSRSCTRLPRASRASFRPRN